MLEICKNEATVDEQRRTRKEKSGLAEPAGPRASYDKETFEANMKAAFGTMREWAQMQDDGSIGVHTSGYAADGTHGTGGFVVLPGEADYENAKQYYSLTKPGDTYHKEEKWVEGQWVTVLEERPNQKPKGGEARSA